MCCSSDPTTFVPSFLFGGYPFIVHWSIPSYHSPKLVPVYFTIRIATLAIISFFIPFQIFIGNNKADFFCLRDDSIYESLSQLIVCISLYFPSNASVRCIDFLCSFFKFSKKPSCLLHISPSIHILQDS